MAKSVLITGAVRNTGLAAAKRFLADGWRVMLTSRRAEDACAAAKDLCCEYGDGRAFGVGLAPADTQSIADAFAQSDAFAPRLDAFVSNAANLGLNLDIFGTTPEQYDAVMNANARGTFFCVQQAVKRMERGGAICVVSSVHSRAALPGRIVYAASKGAINAFVRAAAVELGHRGIRINALLAGAIRTDRWDNMSAEQVAAIRANYPSGKESSPQDIAQAIYFLCSDGSQTMTGSEMTVDSGYLAALGQFDADWRAEEEK